MKSSLDEWDYLEYDEVDRSDELDNSLDHSRFQHESYHSAKAIQKQVRDIAKQRRQDTAENEPGQSDLDVSFEGASKVVPIDLYNHLAWLIHDATFEMGPDGRVSLSKKQHEQVLNVSQDIIAAMSSTPTPKQVGIALHIIKQTRSKETVTLLNRFGICAGYNVAQRYITSMAMRAEDQLSSNGLFIPENIEHGLFTHFAFDNLDFHENNMDGNTTHGTTHIIYQYQNPSDASTSDMSVTIALKKGRSPIHRSTTAI